MQVLAYVSCCFLPFKFHYFGLTEFKAGSEVNISDIQKNLQALCDYNIMLREKLVAAQSMLNDLMTKGSTSAMDSHT